MNCMILLAFRIRISSEAFTNLISACAAVNDVEKAESSLRAMEEMGLPCNARGKVV